MGPIRPEGRKGSFAEGPLMTRISAKAGIAIKHGKKKNNLLTIKTNYIDRISMQNTGFYIIKKVI